MNKQMLNLHLVKKFLAINLDTHMHARPVHGFSFVHISSHISMMRIDLILDSTDSNRGSMFNRRQVDEVQSVEKSWTGLKHTQKSLKVVAQLKLTLITHT